MGISTTSSTPFYVGMYNNIIKNKIKPVIQPNHRKVVSEENMFVVSLDSHLCKGFKDALSRKYSMKKLKIKCQMV